MFPKFVRSQAAYWIRAVSRSLEGHNKIPSPTYVCSTDPILIYADASGVSGGYCCLMEAEGETIYGMGAWRGQLRKRKNWGDNPVSLTFLEALASLAGLLLAPDKVRGITHTHTHNTQHTTHTTQTTHTTHTTHTHTQHTQHTHNTHNTHTHNTTHTTHNTHSVHTHNTTH